MKRGIKGKNSNLNLVLFIILIVLVLIIMFLYFTNINNKSQTNKLDQGELKSLGVYNQGLQTLDATEISDCVVLNQPNTVYTMTNDIVKTNYRDRCIKITAPGITLDCKKHRFNIVFSPSSSSEPLYSAIYSDQDNTIIKNCDINALSWMGNIGIILNQSDNSIVIDNSFTGLTVSNSANVNISYNKIINSTNSQGGSISLRNSVNCIVSNTLAYKINLGGIFEYQSSNNQIIDNVLIDSISPFIWISLSNNSLITNNLISQNYFPIMTGFDKPGYLMIISDSSYNTIKNNDISNNRDLGIKIVDWDGTIQSMNNHIYNNFIYNNSYKPIGNSPSGMCSYSNLRCSFDDNSCDIINMTGNFGTGNIIAGNSGTNDNVRACYDNGNSYWPILGTDYSENINDCVPDCHKSDGTLKTCGSNGCGDLNACGTCANGQTCEFGICVAVCTPDCSNKGCGDDNGCGQMCGCPSGKYCSNNQCEVSCNPKTCSNFIGQCGAQGDGCGGCISCVCTSGQRCSNGLCVNDPNCIANPSTCLTGAGMCGTGTCSTDSDVLSCVSQWRNV